MRGGGSESADLVFHGVHVLHCAEGNNHQGKLRSQAKIAHVAFVQRYSPANIVRLAGKIVLENLEHGPGVVDPVDFGPLTGESAAERARCRKPLRGLAQATVSRGQDRREVHEILFRSVGAIVVLGGHLVGIDGSAHSCFPRDFRESIDLKPRRQIRAAG
jgi:hypothetical protein